MAAGQNNKVDVELPGCPSGPTDPMWPLQSGNGFWKRDGNDPWLGDPNSQAGGGRISPPAGGDTDPDNFGESI
jgi:hypothetical protein